MTRTLLSLPLTFALASAHAAALPDKSEAPLIVAASTAVVTPAEIAQHAPIASDGLRSGLVELDLRSIYVRARSCNAAGCGSWSMPISVPPTSWGICN